MSLPSGYKRLEYIQSSGKQWTDTGFKPTGATKVVIDFQMVSQGSSQQGVFGSRPGTSGRFTVFTGYGTADLQVDYNTEQTLASVGSSITGLNVNSRTTLEVSNSLVINGTTVKTVSATSFTSTYNLFLFANNNAGKAQLPGILKLYSCQIYDNGTLVRDFIPCKNTGGAVGLWDDVNSVFYGNAGTGTFTAGPVVVVIPEAPSNLQQTMSVRLIWAEVSGAEQYNVYRDDTLLGTTTGLFYVDDTAAENTEYTYAVSAVNSAGESSKTTITVYTKSGYFLYKPYVESATFQ